MSQRILHCTGFKFAQTVPPEDIPEGARAVTLGTVTLDIDAGDMPADQVNQQLEQVGQMASELVPIFSAMAGGVDAAELVEVAGELPALHDVPPVVRQAAVELAVQLRAAAADGQVTKSEVMAALLAAGRHAIGL